MTTIEHQRACRRAVAVLSAALGVLAVAGGASALLPDGPITADHRPAAAPEVRAQHPPDAAPAWSSGPPPIMLWVDGRDVTLLPWTSCYTEPSGGAGACMDGMPRPPYEDVGERREVDFRFPIQGWHFRATFDRRGDGCGPVTVKARPTGSYTFRLAPQVAAGDYRVDIFGRGEGGDAVTSFRWTVPARPGVTATC
jgi:hypothetical protein